MPCQSVPHMHKALSCGLLKRFISVTKEKRKTHTKKKQRERINACRLDEVLHFKEAGCTKRSCVCCLSVLLLFKYEMLPGSIFVLPIDSPLFSLAFVRFKRGYISLHRRCFAVYKWKQMYVIGQAVVSYYLLHVTCIS